ncbi:MAG TPA: precorrin-6Y C5,15-methyltransferase (decarboxylating) subunit CbiT [Firmicutes bacterium]|nr:precorrin-6Y C5,15-methyltransferase (decarboxylating) subunit CbiT [Bacillota bacterium]
MISIAAVGPGSSLLITPQVQQRAGQVARILAAEGLAARISLPAEPCPLSEMATRALETDGDCMILVSGDAGFFSMAKLLLRQLEGKAETEVLCGISSMQYFCAKLGRGYENLPFISLHGRNSSFLGAVSYHPAVFLLTGGANRAQEICRMLCDAGLPDLRVFAGENLSAETERILSGTAQSLSMESFSDLTVLLIENDRYQDPHLPPRDTDFIRGEVPMTKEEVRMLSVARLHPAPDDCVWDVGAGTGSVSIALARAAHNGTVYAIEREPDALMLIEKNRQKLGAYNVLPVAGEAPDALEDLPAPDAIFIGGSGGNLGQIIQCAETKNPAVRICITAVTLETLQEAVSALEANGRSSEVIQLQVSRTRKAGRYHMLTAQNPIYMILRGEG